MYLVIAAAGKGSRLGLEHNKIFAELQGKTVLEHCLDTATEFAMKIVLVHSPEEEVIMQEFLDKHGYTGITLVPGGESRQASVLNALERILELEGSLTDSLVGVHDAARCLVSKDLIQRVFSKAEEQGATIPVVPVTDTIKHLSPKGLMTPDRSKLRAAQTPQVAKLADLLPAHRSAFEQGLNCSDDAQVLELAGVQVGTVEGERRNIKLTHPEDFILAKFFLAHEA